MSNSSPELSAETNCTRRKFVILMVVITLVNILLRTLIYVNTNLFYFTDFKTYLDGVDTLLRGEELYLLQGNFIMTISWLGYLAVKVFGSIDWFFALNILAGSAASLLISMLAYRVTGRRRVAVLSMILLTLYTEFMVFSSIFYTPVLMILLLSLFMWSLWYYYLPGSRIRWEWLSIATVIVLLSFTLKPELFFLPVFLFILAVMVRKQKQFAIRTLLLAGVLSVSTLLFYGFRIMPSSPGHTVSNGFVFFGHTEYGGDGGEGAFVYPENEERYKTNFRTYCIDNKIVEPVSKDYNGFRKQEIIVFITQHPFKWMMLQIKKFTRTFGVVPEGNSFKVLYTGLLRERLWLASIIVTAPVALFLLLFIQLFNINLLKDPGGESTSDKRGFQFKYIFLLLLFYYIVAICFFGHFQERYRLPVIVIFLLPLTAVFISEFRLSKYWKKPGFYIRQSVSMMVFTIWVLQAITAISNKERLYNALIDAGELIENKT